MKSDDAERPGDLVRHASRGGKARAKTLSPDERKQIAIAGAEARWGRIPIAEYSGVLEIGDLKIPCSVLEDGTRVFSESGFTKALGRARSGSAWLAGADPGARMPHFAPPKRLISFVGDELAKELMHPLKYRPAKGGKVAYGVKATLIPAICEAWLNARDANLLNPRQMETARKAEILTRGLARVGIIALVDAATGYEKIRPQLELQEILQKFVARELRPWVRRFPFEFYEKIYKLKGWDLSEITPNSPKPLEVGRITDDLVYKRLAPGVRKEIRERTPRNEKGYLAYKLHRWLTEDIGAPKLEKHLGIVMALMDVSPDWPTFKANMDKVLPPFNKNYELALSDEPKLLPGTTPPSGSTTTPTGDAPIV